MEQLRMLANLFSALGHSKRLRILEYLGDGEHCQCELPTVLDIEQSSVSRHVKILIQAGVFLSRKDGTKTMFRISDPAFVDLVQDSRDIMRARVRARIEALHL
ncbi:MAG: winged helix-turn-helix transcriptional regulator [Bacteroidetes bacterium]|nr:winged helix-turn-helix transcriptional regulator [Bacteroidota bacterium]